MAAAKMRHFNSPEEIALRQGQPAGASKRKEFRHYNHPDEVAKRAAAGQPSAAAAVVPQRVRPPAPAAAPWPPAGEPNNAPVETPAVVVDASAGKPDTTPPPPRGDLDQRLRRIETLLYTFLEDVGEAREFRRLLNNQQGVTDSQQDLVNRVRSLELTLDQLAEEDDADDGDEPEVEPELAPDAVPTRDDNGTPSEGGA